jgi:hypothetical protein
MEESPRILVVEHHHANRGIAEYLLTDYDLDFRGQFDASAVRNSNTLFCRILRKSLCHRMTLAAIGIDVSVEGVLRKEWGRRPRPVFRPSRSAVGESLAQ